MASGAGPSAARGGKIPSTPALSFLPAWVQSGVAAITGGAGGWGAGINTSMHCLDSIHSVLVTFVQGVSRQGMAHVSGALFCPCLACKGVIRIHESNGTFVALAEEGKVVYARCADSSCCCDKDDAESGWMDVVKDTGPRPWVKLTEEKLAELQSKVQQLKQANSTRKRKERPPED